MRKADMHYEIESYGASPIDLAMAKLYLKVDNSADDTIITNIINAVTIFAERHTGRELRANSWLGLADNFNCYEFKIHRTNVEDVTIEYVSSGVVKTVDPATYQVANRVLYSIVKPVDGESWPSDVDVRLDAVIFRFTTSPSHITDEVRIAMLKHIASWYENRGDDDAPGAFNATDFYRSSSLPRF